MKRLTTAEADAYLNRIGMQVGGWNRVATTGAEGDKREWLNQRAPENARELHNFSHHLAGWLPQGEWKIFQIDNSTVLDAAQSTLFGRLLFGSERALDLGRMENSSFLFEFGSDPAANNATELLIANLIHVFLLFECHGYVVSSRSQAGQLLGILDGFGYFYSKDADVAGARTLLENFERNPLQPPQWILDLIAEEQERIIGSS